MDGLLNAQLDHGRVELVLEDNQAVLLIHPDSVGGVHPVPLSVSDELLVAHRWRWSETLVPIAQQGLRWVAGMVASRARTWLLIEHEDREVITAQFQSAKNGGITHPVCAQREGDQVTVEGTTTIPQPVRKWLMKRVESPVQERPGFDLTNGVPEDGESKGASPIERMRLQHAARLGEDPGRVRAFRMDLDALMTLGTLAAVHVLGTSMFSVQASWEDLGISEDDVRRERFSRPLIYLLPSKLRSKLGSLNSQARKNLDRYSFDEQGFRPWRWIPFTAYRAWRQKHLKMVEKWDELRKTEILGKRDELLGLLEKDIRLVAADTYVTLTNSITEPSSLPEQAAFIERFVERILARFPTPEAIRANLRLEYSTSALINPTLIEQELAARDRVRMERQAEAEAYRREQTLLWERKDAERAELRARQKSATQQMRMLELEEQCKRDQLEEMRRVELNHYRQQLEEMTSPVTGVVNQLRAQIYEGAQALAESLKKHGSLIGPSARRARNMVKTFRLLDGLDDKELAELIDQIDVQINESAPERNVGEIQAVMDDIVNLTRQAAVDVELAQRGRGRWAAVKALKS